MGGSGNQAHSQGIRTYNKNKGIIATREKYLEYLKSDKGGQDLQEAEKEVAKAEGKFGKTIIVPVAVPGRGTYSLFHSN